MKKNAWIVSPAPFLLTRPTVSKMTIVTAATLLPQVLILAYVGDIPALVTIAAAMAGSALAELAYAIPQRKKAFTDYSALLAGLLAGMLLPSTLNPVISLVVSFTGVLVARNLFGGAGSFWMHPVAVTIAIAYISNAAFFPQELVTGDGIRSAGEAFGAFKLDGFAQDPYDQSVTGSINTAFLRLFGIKLPEGYITLFLSSPSVIPAFRYNALTLFASIILIAMDIIDWIVPLIFLVTYGLLIHFVSLLPFVSGNSGGDILFAFLTSGTLFTAFYLLPEYSTNPRTKAGKVITGIIAGIAAFAISGPGGSPAGGAFTVVLVNALNPVIEYLENRVIASAGDFA